MVETAVKCQSSTCINGNPPSRLECPTCAKSALSSLRLLRDLIILCRLGIAGSFFCGQECFKAGCTLPASSRFIEPIMNFRRGSFFSVLCLLPPVYRLLNATFRKPTNLSTTLPAVSVLFLWNPMVSPFHVSNRPVWFLNVCRFLDSSYNPFPNFTFSGSLRPAYPLSARRHIPDHIVRPDYAEDG